MSTGADSIEYFTIPDFQFASGVQKEIKVAYRSFNSKSKNGTVLIPTCFGGRVDKTLNFTSGALKDYHVVVVAMLGNGESSSPSNDAEFPSDYSLRYQVSIDEAMLVSQLQIKIADLNGNVGLYQRSVCTSYPASWCEKSGGSNRLLDGRTASILLGRDAWLWQ